MSTYKEIFGKPIKSLSGDPNPTPITYTVTAADNGSGVTVYFIDGVMQKTLELYEGNTYNFDYSGASSHPFRFSTTANGTHSGGVEYTNGVSVDSNITTIIVQTGTPTLYYYCSSHPNMGGTALTPGADANIEGQIWYNETLGKFRSVVMTGAFSSGGSLNTGRYAIGNAGTFTAGLAFGGDLFPAPYPSRGSNSSEEYDGTSWTSGNNLGTSASWRAGAGTQTAASGTAGNNYSSYISNSENYDGTSWTASTSAPYAAEGAVSTGSRPASIWGGGGSPPGAYPGSMFYGDGEGWTAITATNNDKRYASVFTGTQTAALLTGGSSPQTANVESWDGSSWSNETSFPNILANGGGNRVGTSTSGVVAGGASTAVPGQNLTSTHWDGTAWSADADLASNKTSSATAGTQSQYWIAGAPNPGSAPARSATEEYEKTIYSVTAAAWSSGGTMNTARLGGAAGGSQTAAFYAGGRVGPPGGTADSEEYNGTSWTEGNNLNTPRQYVEGAGVQTAGLAAGGYPATGATEEYNGTSWTSQPNSMGTSRGFGGMAGSQTSAVYAGGVYPSTAVTALVEEYNGTAWSEQNDLSQARKYLGSAGSADTNMMVFGGSDQPGSTKYANTEEYDGSSWTNGGALGTARQSLGGQPGGPGSKAGALACGGYVTTSQSLTEEYDGTSWSSKPALATARHDIRGAGSTTAGLAMGGEAPPGILGTTEEYNGAVTRLDYKSISSS